MAAELKTLKDLIITDEDLDYVHVITLHEEAIKWLSKENMDELHKEFMRTTAGGTWTLRQYNNLFAGFVVRRMLNIEEEKRGEE